MGGRTSSNAHENLSYESTLFCDLFTESRSSIRCSFCFSSYHRGQFSQKLPLYNEGRCFPVLITVFSRSLPSPTGSAPVSGFPGTRVSHPLPAPVFVIVALLEQCLVAPVGCRLTVALLHVDSPSEPRVGGAVPSVMPVPDTSYNFGLDVVTSQPLVFHGPERLTCPPLTVGQAGRCRWPV